MAAPKITSIEVHEFEQEISDVGRDEMGFNVVYTPGSKLKSTATVLRILTDAGVVGEWLGGSPAEHATLPMFANYLIGKGALERERIYTDVNRALRQVARIGLAPVDIALWDLAGKYYDAPIHQLLGGYKTSLPYWSANSFRVQLARPSGGSPQAIAINRASPSPSSLF